MRWYWWVAIIGGLYYFSKSSTNISLIPITSSSSLHTLVANKLGPGIENLNVTTDVNGIITITYKQNNQEYTINSNIQDINEWITH